MRKTILRVSGIYYNLRTRTQ